MVLISRFADLFVQLNLCDTRFWEELGSMFAIQATPIGEQHDEFARLSAVSHAMIAISDGVKALIDQALEGCSPRHMVLRAYHFRSSTSHR